MTPYLQKGIWQKGPLCQPFSAVVWHESCPAYVTIGLFSLVMPKLLGTPVCFLAACVHVLRWYADLCILC